MRNYLLDLRAEKGLSQAQVAIAAGIAQGYYCDIEHGEKQKNMTVKTMSRLATAFKVPLQEILQAETKYAAEAGRILAPGA